MTSAEIRKKFLEFFEKRGHKIIPSASLVPENDPTTLFTSSGMQPLIPYLLGQSHPLGKRLVNSQKCFRAEDIDEVGDNRHTTFFEMLGNWSFGDYWKEEQLGWVFEFLTKEVGLPADKLYVTVFSGDEGISRDDESVGILQRIFEKEGIAAKYALLGTEEEGSKRGMKEDERIFGYGEKKNWWSRSGAPANMPAGEPGGPDSEIFYDFGTPHDKKFGEYCHPNCDCGRFMEIGNSVFMEYRKKADGDFERLPRRNVDFGGGLERITAAANNDPDMFDIDVFREMEKQFPKSQNEDARKRRIILDHLRAVTFLMTDGVEPSNKGGGYILRRLIRRMAFHFFALYGRTQNDTTRIGDIILSLVKIYERQYPDIKSRYVSIVPKLEDEIERFEYSLDEGTREFLKLSSSGKISGKDAFILFSTHGFPYEMIFELAKEKGIEINKAEFEAEFEKHKELSRTASAGMFKGGLADHSEKTTRLHTAHHLLLKALQIVLGAEVKQRGSNINQERLRLDFVHDKKMTDDEKKEVERIVNEKIAEDLPVIRSELPREEAEQLGAEHEFGQKYPDKVSVYSVGPKSATSEDPKFKEAFSIEFCGGPHVQHTGEIGKFRIKKEEASSAGVRRIRGVIE